jgi:hypothetical protein
VSAASLNVLRACLRAVEAAAGHEDGGGTCQLSLASGAQGLLGLLLLSALLPEM